MSNILNISASYPSDAFNDFGGIHVHRQNIGLCRLGWGIKVISPQPLGYRFIAGLHDQYRHKSQISNIDIWRPRYFHIPRLNGKYRDFWYKQAILKVYRQIIEDWKPDLIVCDWIIPGGLAAIQIAQERKLPLVFKVHGADARTIQKRVGFSQAWRKYYEQFNICDLVVCNGEGLLQTILGLEIFDAQKVINIPIGVDTSIFFPPSYDERNLLRMSNKISSDAIVILFVGRWENAKGSHDMAKVVSDIMSIYSDIYFIVVGSVKDEHSYKELIASRFENHIRFLGSVEPSRVAEFMKLSDIFLLPSYKEGLPASLLEAMASSLVPIVSRVGGMPFLIKHTENGLVIDPGDREGLFKSLNDVISSAELRKLMQEKSLQDVEKYDLNSTVYSIDRFYRNLL